MMIAVARLRAGVGVLGALLQQFALLGPPRRRSRGSCPSRPCRRRTGRSSPRRRTPRSGAGRSSASVPRACCRSAARLHRDALLLRIVGRQAAKVLEVLCRISTSAAWYGVEIALVARDDVAALAGLGILHLRQQTRQFVAHLMRVLDPMVGLDEMWRCSRRRPPRSGAA